MKHLEVSKVFSSRGCPLLRDVVERISFSRERKRKEKYGFCEIIRIRECIMAIGDRVEDIWWRNQSDRSIDTGWR
jgi:hypothetical protein